MDAARQWTDKELESMTQQIRDIYAEANKSITKDWNEYMTRGQRKLSALYVQMDKEGTQEAAEAYQKAAAQYTLRNERYREMVADTTRRIADANQIALDYSNGKLPQFYAMNYNEAVNFGFKFSLISEDVVRRRIVEGDIKLPYKTVDIPKDMRWNTKKINSSVLQGIIRGESMDKIAKRIQPVVDNNRDAAIRNARTMVTGAENIGRLDSYKRLESSGVIMQKMWLATPGGRTRDWHADMDGQTVNNDDPFIDGLGNPLMFPGDPLGEPCSVYNCRCTMTADIKGFA